MCAYTQVTIAFVQRTNDLPGTDASVVLVVARQDLVDCKSMNSNAFAEISTSFAVVGSTHGVFGLVTRSYNIHFSLGISKVASVLVSRCRCLNHAMAVYSKS